MQGSPCKHQISVRWCCNTLQASLGGERRRLAVRAWGSVGLNSGGRRKGKNINIRRKSAARRDTEMITSTLNFMTSYRRRDEFVGFGGSGWREGGNRRRERADH